MFVVTAANAGAGAKRRGVTIPGNLVLGVRRNVFAVRMLKTSVASGIGAPLRLYVTANPDKTATLTYRNPNAVFGVYGSAALNKKAAEIIKKIVESAIANAEHNEGADVDELRISAICVDEGPTMKRLRARAKGRANRILKRTSHITVTVADR